MSFICTPSNIIYFLRTDLYIYIITILIGSGLLEFGEFCQLSAKFLVEEDEEGLKKELKEAFRIYDKEGTLRLLLKFIS